jgi:hypothetical protein
MSREELIKAAWKEHGKAQWNPETHGRGLETLEVQVPVEMKPQSPILGAKPLPPYDILQFRFERAASSGRAYDAIVCEGVVVEIVPRA